jgi:hypothetical protein
VKCTFCILLSLIAIAFFDLTELTLFSGIFFGVFVYAEVRTGRFFGKIGDGNMVSAAFSSFEHAVETVGSI